MASQKRPNIIFIMADDHAAKAISCYGAGINSTPNLDRIAKEGMLFNHCYVTNSICTPSRAAILCGTHNHVNGVMTLDSTINSRMPNVAKHLRTGGYQTAMVGKWHLGEGKESEPTGFDYWSVVPGQGEYWDPAFIEPDGSKRVQGYATDIITDNSIDWLKARDTTRPFFLMCHHKAPHRSWECDEKHKGLYREPVRLPDTFSDDYKNRAKAAGIAKMRVAEDLTYFDLGIAQPDGGRGVGEKMIDRATWLDRKIPAPEDVTKLRLIDKEDGSVFTFQTKGELAEWKFQRYMQRYLRTIQSVDDNVGRLLDWLDAEDLAENTVVIYTSDRALSPSTTLVPLALAPFRSASKSSFTATTSSATWTSRRRSSTSRACRRRRTCKGRASGGWQQVAYHRYWKHRDVIHEAYAHYGVRDQRYKLIYWYAEDLGLPGTRPGGQEKEWELFDCQEDPLELLNVYQDARYAEVVKRMTRLLEQRMLEIGDEPMHPRA